jgi:TRAP-type C4-dicarboxylate transport system permease large subunit
MYSAIVVVIPLIAPLALSYGIDPFHLGIIFLTNLELGFLTPPVGMNLFLASYRFKRPLLEVYRAVLPFLAIRITAVALVTYVPALTMTLPGWLL